MINTRALRLPLSWRRDPYRTVTFAAAAVAPLLLLAILIMLVTQSQTSFARAGLRFLVNQAWNPVTLDFGALPFIYGTLVTSFLALALALVVGLGVALLLAEPGAGPVRATIGVGVELLAAIPSVVFGLWALYVMAPFVLAHLEQPAAERLAFIPIFGGPARQTSLLTATLVLAVMILPTLAAVSRDVIRAVPNGLREAGVALGATWFETTWKIVLPAARSGIFGASILALGRALGETIAVTMVIGNRPEISASLFAPSYTLASVIANEFTEATGTDYPAALIELGLVLMLLTLVVNLLAQLLLHATRGRQLAIR